MASGAVPPARTRSAVYHRSTAASAAHVASPSGYAAPRPTAAANPAGGAAPAPRTPACCPATRAPAPRATPPRAATASAVPPRSCASAP